MNNDTKFLIIGIAIIVFLVSIGLFVENHITEKQDNSCKEIGFESYTSRVGMKYCKDSKGNLHYVDQECDFFMTNCKTRKISVGDVRTVSERGNRDD